MNGHRKLLVITYHHPPDGAIGGMRWAGFTRYLADLQWESLLITAARVNGAPQPAGVTTLSCPRRTTLNDLYKGVRLRDKPRTGQQNGNGAPASNGDGLLSRLKFEAGMLLALPDDGRGWVFRAARHARRVISRERPDVVVSSGPPHSAHLVAWLATRGTNTPWLADFRDPWAGQLAGAWRSSALQRSALARLILPRLERLVVRAADGVLCNTREFAAAMSERYPDARVSWIPNGVDRGVLPARRDPPFEGLAIVHAGTLYGGRTLETVFDALRLFLDAHPDATRDGTRLRIAGQVERAYEHRLTAQIAARGLETQVEQLGVVPRDDALQLLLRSRFALVLAQDQDLQVPAKLYELVGMGIPTVVIAGQGSAAASEARRLGVETIDAGDARGIAAAFARAWADRSGRRPTVDYQGLDYRALSTELDSVLKSVARPG